MTDQRAEAIVQRFNEGQQTRNFTHAFNEIRQAQQENPNFWRQYGQRVNDGVNFQQLGFSTDFEVLGLNNRGQLITSDNNGMSQQRRSANQLNVVGNDTAPANAEAWGNNGRRFQTNADGRYTFTIRQGDYIDRVARDIVAHNTGRTPSEADVVRAREAIQRENNIQNIHNVPNGTTLRIPESLVNRNGAPGQPGARPGDVPPPPPPVPRESGQPPTPGADRTPLPQRGLPASSRPASEGGFYRMHSPPGVSEDPGVYDRNVQGAYGEWERTNRQTRPGTGNRDVTTYDTQIGAFGFRRDVSVSEEVNRTTGILERRSVNYQQDGVSFHVRTPQGSQELTNVRSVDIVRDAATGQYTATYTMRDGRAFRGVTMPDGTPRYWNQVSR